METEMYKDWNENTKLLHTTLNISADQGSTILVEGVDMVILISFLGLRKPEKLVFLLATNFVSL